MSSIRSNRLEVRSEIIVKSENRGEFEHDGLAGQSP
jgi:hypothetical protein